jgi:hypothetical protein
MVLLDIDTVTERLVQTGLHLAGQDPNDRDSPWFKKEFREAVYQSLFRSELLHSCLHADQAKLLKRMSRT